MSSRMSSAMGRKSKTQKKGSGKKSVIGKNAFPSGRSVEKEEYKVGPGRPPREHRFKPGQSGNPRGAKRKTPSLIPDLKKLFERAFNRKAKVTQGERERIMCMWGSGMEQLSIQFAKGDRHARRDAFWVAELVGSNFLTPKSAVDETLAGDRQAILDAYVERQTQQKVSSAPSRVLAPPELLDDDTSDEPEKK
jgi:hypothetical protein